MQCEADYVTGIKIYEAIVQKKIFDTTVNQIKSMQENIDDPVSSPKSIMDKSKSMLDKCMSTSTNQHMLDKCMSTMSEQTMPTMYGQSMTNMPEQTMPTMPEQSMTNTPNMPEQTMPTMPEQSKFSMVADLEPTPTISNQAFSNQANSIMTQPNQRY